MTTTNKCSKCNKKCNDFNIWLCKCNHNFCTKHRFPFEHNCTINYKEQESKKLETIILKCIPSKIEKI